MIFFPHYALGSGMKNIYSSYEYNQICDFQKNGKFSVVLLRVVYGFSSKKKRANLIL